MAVILESEHPTTSLVSRLAKVLPSNVVLKQAKQYFSVGFDGHRGKTLWIQEQRSGILVRLLDNVRESLTPILEHVLHKTYDLREDRGAVAWKELNEKQLIDVVVAVEKFLDKNSDSKTKLSTSTILLTWNPKKFNDGGDGTGDFQLDLKVGDTTRWNCNTNKVSVGDVVYLIRLGVEPKGIVIKGTVTKESYKDQDWSDATKERSYIDFKVDEMRMDCASGLLPMVLLNMAMPDQQWTPFASGIAVRDDVQSILQRLWGAGEGKHSLSQYIDWSKNDPKESRKNWLESYQKTIAMAKAIQLNPESIDDQSLNILWREKENGVSNIGPGILSSQVFQRNIGLLRQMTEQILAHPDESTFLDIEAQWRQAVDRKEFQKMHRVVYRRVFSAAAPDKYTTLMRVVHCNKLLSVFKSQFQVSFPGENENWAQQNNNIKQCLSIAGVSGDAIEINIALWGLYVATSSESETGGKLRFVPIRLMHNERMPWERVTHVRLLDQSADTSSAKVAIDHIRQFADEDDIAAITDIEPDFPGRSLTTNGRTSAMRIDLRHFSNTRDAGANSENKGLVELGYLSNDDNEDDERDTVMENYTLVPVNQILYGPPGTGKTYNTINEALRILEPRLLADSGVEREALLEAFNRYKDAGQIVFCTFHQSFSYEDFVEGLRANTDNGQVNYSVEAGIFKQLCQEAIKNSDQPTADDLLNGFIEQVAENPATLETSRGKRFAVSYKYGNATLTCLPEASEAGRELPANISHIRQYMQGIRPGNIYCESYVKGIADHINAQLPLGEAHRPLSQAGIKPFVLIIDEINRGNISRIFGELITLVEPSKRAGQPEALSVQLPYSKELFSVPSNVYLIGTMNTADRSLAGLDIALRRRFTFKEMPPIYTDLDKINVDELNIGLLLRKINERIEVLLDRDHCLGHAYFLPLQQVNTIDRLAFIFRQQIIPLLQEYFFEDWERIAWVLNDQNKDRSLQFIQKYESNLAGLFDAETAGKLQDRRWIINESAFDNIASYHAILGAGA